MNLSEKIAVISGVVSAILWCASAFVNLPFGFDMDTSLKKAFKRASLLNAIAAIFAAISVVASNATNINHLFSN